MAQELHDQSPMSFALPPTWFQRGLLPGLPLTVCVISLSIGGVVEAQDQGGMLEVQFQRGGPIRAARLGRTVVSAQDFDGDGYRDLLTTAMESPDAQVLLFSSRTGDLLLRISYPRTYGDYDKESIASLPDVDGDGVPEIAVGEQHATSATSNEGMVTLYSGATGAVIWTFVNATAEEHVGSGMATPGDVNMDGHDDLLVHASGLQDPASPNHPGGALLLSGLDGSVLRKLYVPDLGYGHLGENRVASPGDVDGDGVPDLLVAGLGEYYYQTRPGRVVLFSGATGVMIREHVENLPYRDYATSVAGVGDLNSDGIGEYAISLPEGKLVQVHDGASGAVVHDLEERRDPDFGAALAGGSDHDGDGTPDILVSNHQDGSFHIFSGGSGDKIMTVEPFRRWDIPGFAVAAMDDLDGDGVDEFAWGGSQHHLPGAPHFSGFVRMAGIARCIRQNTSSVSAALGGTIHWQLDFPNAEAGQEYLLLASSSGATPSSFEGTTVPLTQDGVFARMVVHPPNSFARSFGILDAFGQATAALRLPSGAATSRVGSTIWFAAVVGPTGGRHGSSVAIPLTITP